MKPRSALQRNYNMLFYTLKRKKTNSIKYILEFWLDINSWGGTAQKVV